jgi:hypothetical protein
MADDSHCEGRGHVFWIRNVNYNDLLLESGCGTCLGRDSGDAMLAFVIQALRNYNKNIKDVQFRAHAV